MFVQITCMYINRQKAKEETFPMLALISMLSDPD